MSDNKDKSGKAILIGTIICIVIGVCFVFRIDQKISDLFNGSQTKNNNVINTEDNPELRNLPQLPNMIVIYGGNFLPKEITVKEGEVISFYNVDASPTKVIGDGWQSAYIDKSAAFAKGDLKKGEYTAYLENNPGSIIKIKIK